MFEAVGPHFKSQNGEIWYEDADPGIPIQVKFSKNRLRGITNFGDFCGCKPTF